MGSAQSHSHSTGTLLDRSYQRKQSGGLSSSSTSHQSRHAYERKSSASSHSHSERSRSLFRKSSSSSLHSRSSDRKSRHHHHKASNEAGRIRMTALATGSERQKLRLKRYLKESFKVTTCPETYAQTTRISLNLWAQPLRLEHPFVLAILAKYFAKYSTTTDIEFEVIASNTDAWSFGSTDTMDCSNSSVGLEVKKGRDVHLSVDGLVELVRSSSVFRVNLTSLHIGKGCSLKGNLLRLFRDVLPFLPNLRRLQLDNLRVNTTVAAHIFSSWRHKSSLERVELQSLHGDFGELFGAMASNHENLPFLKEVKLCNMYICEAGAVVQAAGKYLGNTKTLQHLHLSFADEFESNLEPLGNGILMNANQSHFGSLTVQDVRGQCFPVTSMSELDSFLQCVTVCPSLQHLGLDISPSLIVSSSATDPPPANDARPANDTQQREATAQKKVDLLKFQLRLNQHPLGHDLLKEDAKPSLKEWVSAIIEAKDDTGVIYHYLSHDPTVVGSGLPQSPLTSAR